MREEVANFIEDLSQRDFIVFAGAGIAKPTGIPDWKGLMKALADEQPLGGVNIDDIEECLYPEVAQMLFTLYEINGKVEDYYRIIRQKLESKTASHMPLQRKIIKGGGSIITTNLDTTFEAAFKEEFKDVYHYTGRKENYKTQSLPELCAEKAKTRNFITYLHGKYNSEKMILKTADYERYYCTMVGRTGNSVIEEFLKDVYKENTLVFIGFSFSDRYLSRLLMKISDDINKKSIEKEENFINKSIDERKRHYALLDDINFGNNNYLLQNINTFDKESKDFKRAMMLKSRIELEERLEIMGIKVVRYDYEKYKQMENWFSNVADKRDVRRGAWVDESKKKDIGTDMPRLG